MPHSRELEAARGLAILLVIALHYSPFFFPFSDIVESLGPFAAVVRGGRTGVILFFVLSAFLLIQPFIREWRGGPQVSIAGFFYRRALRILPLFFCAVLFAYLWRDELSGALRALVFLSDRHTLQPFSDVWWSLRTEVQFYLALGVGALALRYRVTRWMMLAATLLYVPLYLGVASRTIALEDLGFVGIESKNNMLYSIAIQAPVFIVGATAAWIYSKWGTELRSRAAKSRILSHGGGDLVLFATLALLFAVLTSVIDESSFLYVLNQRPYWTLIEGTIWSAFVLTLLLLPLYSRALFVNPAMELLGRISYSVYLIHVPLLKLSGPLRHSVLGPQMTTWRRWSDLILVLGICLVMSWISYRVIERPILTLKARFRR